jgi:hypothetical protein
VSNKKFAVENSRYEGIFKVALEHQLCIIMKNVKHSRVLSIQGLKQNVQIFFRFGCFSSNFGLKKREIIPHRLQLSLSEYLSFQGDFSSVMDQPQQQGRPQTVFCKVLQTFDNWSEDVRNSESNARLCSSFKVLPCGSN